MYKKISCTVILIAGAIGSLTRLITAGQTEFYGPTIGSKPGALGISDRCTNMAKEGDTGSMYVLGRQYHGVMKDMASTYAGGFAQKTL